MTGRDQALFKQGKRLDAEGKHQEAIIALTRAIQLNDHNADYQAWLAREYNISQEYDRAVAAADESIRLDTNCSLAYRQRGYAYLRSNQYDAAVRDLSKAIQLNPDDEVAYAHRASAYGGVLNFERGLIDQAKHNQLRRFGTLEYSHSGDRHFEFWWRAEYEHLRTQVLPRTKSNRELFISYWETYLTWGKTAEVRSHGGDAYTFTSFNYGSGYISLSDKHVYLATLGQVSEKYPAFKRGIAWDFLSIGLLNTNAAMEKNDRLWTLSYQTVNDSQESDGKIVLVTPAITWEIMPLNAGAIPFILAGLSMGASHKWDEIRGTGHSVKSSRGGSDVFELLQKLSGLREAGIISEEEFKQKKRELLARL